MSPPSADQVWTAQSGPISRVLSRTVIYLGAHVTVRLLARYPSADRAGPSRSYSRLLRMGFTKPPRCRDAGGLLHHRFSFSLYACAQVGVFFSAALSVGSPRLAVSQHPALWSPDFPHAGVSPGRATVWPALQGHIVASEAIVASHYSAAWARSGKTYRFTTDDGIKTQTGPLPSREAGPNQSAMRARRP